MKPVICLMGPTASGKTALACKLHDALSLEIVSVDSALVYRGMDIGTAKPSQTMLQRYPHRLLSFLDPAEPYSVGEFCKDAKKAIAEIQNANHIPLLVGGTMLYFHALQQGIAELPQGNQLIRQQLAKKLNEDGLAALYQRLHDIDPDSAKRIDSNDPQRILRALEVYEISGKTLTELWGQQSPAPSDYHFINIAIAPHDRSVLHKHIAERFAQLVNNGLIEEVKELRSRGDLTLDMPSMRAVGYRQVWQYLDGKYTYDEMIEKAIVATRQLAKRQLTWLRRWKNIQWFDSSEPLLAEHVIHYLTPLLEYKN